MAYTALTAAQTDADSPVDQTFTDLLRTNFDDHEARIAAITLATQNQIVEHFFISALDTSTWITAGSAPSFGVPIDGSHQILVNASAAGFGILTSAVGKGRFRLNNNQALYIECRAKTEELSNAANAILIGFQDATLADVVATVSDQTDMVGFVKGTTAGQWKFRTAKAASASEDDDVASRAAWHIFRLELAKTGGGLTLAASVDGVAVSGSPFSTNIPDTVYLRPFFGIGAGVDGVLIYIDYVEMKWTSITDLT